MRENKDIKMTLNLGLAKVELSTTARLEHTLRSLPIDSILKCRSSSVNLVVDCDLCDLEKVSPACNRRQDQVQIKEFLFQENDPCFELTMNMAMNMNERKKLN